jgi:hypothetical protein
MDAMMVAEGERMQAEAEQSAKDAEYKVYGQDEEAEE